VSARMTEPSATAPRMWELDLACGHTSTRVVRYSPGTRGNKYHPAPVTAALPHPASSRCEHLSHRNVEEPRAAVEEQWRPVAADSRYEVSDFGNVRYEGRPVKPFLHVTNSGRKYLGISIGHKSVRLHRVILMAFRPLEPRRRAMGRHLDDDPQNNKLSNLAWGTQHDNLLDASRNGVHPTGRKTQCPQGHPYDAENTLPGHQPNGRPQRRCKICRAEQLKKAHTKYMLKKRAEKQASQSPEGRE